MHGHRSPTTHLLSFALPHLARWQNTKGEPGPWSEVVSAKVHG